MKCLTSVLLLLLAAGLNAQEDCQCATHANAECAKEGVDCACTLQVGPEELRVDCSKLLPKCLLMKREALAKDGRRPKDFTVIDNDGLYNPDCDDSGIFHARQCNGTETCWCVNSAGVRRTDKKDRSDKSLKCDRLVRTFWIEVKMKLNDSEPENEAAATAFKEALTKAITDSYKLPKKHISIELEGPFVYVDLKQNVSEKAPTDPDIADVAYYMEKDIKRISQLPSESQFDIVVNGKSVGVKEPLILYIDSERPEISMQYLTDGIIAVIVVVLVAIVAGIVILVFTLRKRGSYKKVEVKEMTTMPQVLTS